MIKLIFIAIIIYIIIQHFMDCEDEQNNNKPNYQSPIKNDIHRNYDTELIKPSNYSREHSILPTNVVEPRIDEIKNQINQVTRINPPKNIQTDNKQKVWEFDKPNPWTKIIFNQNDDFPYYFHIKLKIPSLNDYQNWKQVVPNIDFNPRTGEMIIPSKDEPSALALTNLIVTNFTGQLSLGDILEKKLIQISINKAKNHEVVQNKLRNQIMENLYGVSESKVQTNNYENDLANNEKQNVDFTSEKFKDTFEHYSSKQTTHDMIDAYDGGDYSYL